MIRFLLFARRLIALMLRAVDAVALALLETFRMKSLELKKPSLGAAVSFDFGSLRSRRLRCFLAADLGL